MVNFKIENVEIGDNHPPIVIAEIGINHEGSLDTAITIAQSAINAGAHLIKHQTHIVHDEMSNEAKSVIPGNADVSIYEIMERCALNEEDEKELMDYVNSNGSVFISTPFSRAAVDRLVKFDVPAFKIGSGECNNYPLVEYIASFGKPVILSTGMNSIQTIAPSVDIFRKNKIPFALLHTTNIYPTPHHLVRLPAMNQLKKEFPDAVVGLSDHTTSNNACLGAVALGASILERHFTDDMNRSGPDIICSMDPTSLKDLVKGSQEIFESRIDSKKDFVDEEKPTISFAFASVVAIRPIKKGEELTYDNIWVKRPSGGDFNASDYNSLIGRIACQDIKSGFQLKSSFLEDISS